MGGTVKNIEVRISSEQISHKNIVEFLKCSSCGAQACFFGVTRDLNQGNEVAGITYDVFEPLAIKVLTEIAFEARNKAKNFPRMIILHRTGYVAVGEISLAVGVSSPHRQAAFEACHLIVEEIKKRAPIWKLEHYQDGSSKWLKGNSLIPFCNKEAA